MAPRAWPASSIAVWIRYCSMPSLSKSSGLAAVLRARWTVSATPSRAAIMPQHSFGASARACSTISSRSCLEMRWGLLGALEGRRLLLVVLAAVAADGLLELAHAAPARLADLGEALGTQD